MRAQELQCVGGARMPACKIRFWPEIEQERAMGGLRSMRAQELQCVGGACMRVHGARVRNRAVGQTAQDEIGQQLRS